jgi:hypothetical protein
MQNLKIKIFVSHNEVTPNYSVMSQPSTMVVELNDDKTKVWDEVGKFNPSILQVWGQKIWDMTHPNTYGQVFKVDILN